MQFAQTHNTRISIAVFMMLLLVTIGIGLVIWKSDMGAAIVMAQSSHFSNIMPAKYLTAAPTVLGTTNQLLVAKTNVGFVDWRAYVLDSYFAANSSPLYGTGKIFVAACDSYGAPADCTTVAAIARAETDLCKYHNSAEYHNCWGFGGGGAYRMYFNSWEESINLVTDRLVNSYGIQYMINPSLMEKTFCGSEPGCTNWGSRVKYHMNEISNFALRSGFNRTLFSVR